MISAIIVNYHCAALTARAVESVLREAEESEVFVVDNSADQNEALELKKRLPAGVNLIVNSSNEGFGRACNAAYKQSRGDMVLLLNPDAYLSPGALGLLKEALLAHPKAGAAGPKIYWDDAKQFHLPPSLFPSPWLTLLNGLWRLHPLLGRLHSLAFRRHALRIWTSTQTVPDTALSGGHVLLKRSAVEDCGGLFDDRYFMFYEDSDLMLRLKRTGYRLYVVPTAECVHNYEHKASKSALMQDAAIQYFAKNYRHSILLRLAKRLFNKPAEFPQHAFTDLGEVDSTLNLDVPEALRSGWLLEISPSPLFLPAIGHFGRGGAAEIPASCLERLHPGHYFCRIASPKALPRHVKQWRWSRPEVNAPWTSTH